MYYQVNCVSWTHLDQDQVDKLETYSDDDLVEILGDESQTTGFIAEPLSLDQVLAEAGEGQLIVVAKDGYLYQSLLEKGLEPEKGYWSGESRFTT